MKKQTIKYFSWEVLKLMIPAFALLLLDYNTFSSQFDTNEKESITVISLDCWTQFCNLQM